MKVVIKAVHLRSREYDIVRYMDSPLLRKDPRNHLIRMFSARYDHTCHKLIRFCVAILDLIEVSESNLAFIVMEEWSPNFVPDPPSTLRLFLGALRQCIEVSGLPNLSLT